MVGRCVQGSPYTVTPLGTARTADHGTCAGLTVLTDRELPHRDTDLMRLVENYPLPTDAQKLDVLC